MDTKTQNQMQVNLPPTLSLDPATVSLADLRQIKQTWLDLAREQGYLKAAREVATELGERFEHEMRTPWNTEPAWRWEQDGVKIRVYQRNGKYLPGLKQYEVAHQMTIEALDSLGNPHLVCRYRFFNHELYTDPNGFIVLGQWLLTVLAAKPEAEAELVNGIKAQHETERQALLRLLCIGQEV